VATPTRLANKTMWALDDITAAAIDARTAWRTCQDIAERRMDATMLAKLGRISDALARIETTAREARQGRYTESE
jgi:hypothetical protein